MSHRKTLTSEMQRLTVDQYREAQKVPLTVVLDNVRSQHNIGAVFRTADAFRLEQVILCWICCCPPNAEIHKTALGAEQSVSWRYAAETADAVKQLQQAGYRVYAVEQTHGSITLEEAAEACRQTVQDGRRGVAGVFGHEVFGVQQEVSDAADGCIEIPQYGTKHSLNVSVTAGIVLYTLAQAMMNN